MVDLFRFCLMLSNGFYLIDIALSISSDISVISSLLNSENYSRIQWLNFMCNAAVSSPSEAIFSDWISWPGRLSVLQYFQGRLYALNLCSSMVFCEANISCFSFSTASSWLKGLHLSQLLCRRLLSVQIPVPGTQKRLRGCQG